MNRENLLKFAEYSGELLQLEADIQKHSEESKGKKGYCANRAWSINPNFKKRMCALVGREASNPLLQSMKAYDAVYEYLYNLLPTCKHDALFCS